MSIRAMYKGVLVLGDERVPVKLYAALESRRTDFRLLHAEDHEPVRQEMVDPESEQPVPTEDIRKGLEVEPGVFAVLDEDELAALDPPSSRELALTRFVPLAAIDDRWYDRAYWLGPDGEVEAYFALAQALREAGREGVCQWSMRSRSYQGSLRARGDHLVLVRLRHPEEVVPLAALPRPSGRELEPRELELAEQLIGALAGDFAPEDFPETYADRVRELVAAKAAGEAIELAPPAPKAEAEDEDLSEALERSLAAAGGA